MTDVVQSPILRLTRWLVYLILGLLAFAALLVLAGAALLPIYWQEAVAAILQEHPGMDTGTLFPWLYVIFGLGLVVMGLVATILRKLLAIIASVELGDPFNIANAQRLKAIGWLMVTAQLVSFPLAVAASRTADLFGPNHVDVELPLNGILAILLVFILAGIFERGAEMREELEGTV